MRILIIEDNVTTADYLSKGLQENYFIPDVAYDGLTGLHLATTNQYDIIILDVMIPHLNGWTIIKKLRADGIQTSVLFLTAKDNIEDKVQGLELGADDYLTKPFAFSELLARIRSLLRRKQPNYTEIISIANLIIDLKKHKVTRDNLPITLSAKEFMLLVLLVNRKGEILSRTFIAEQVWDINFDSDTNVIDVAIKRLRDKIDKDFQQKLIHSVRGVGYVLEER